jgi:hypothetical protein
VLGYQARLPHQEDVPDLQQPYEAFLRNLFNRMLGCLHHCLHTGKRYDEATAFPVAETEERAAAA